MSKTVILAFNDFQKEIVNLDFEDNKKARSSRDWLVEKIFKFEENYDDFPKLYRDKKIFFGSFARKTKKRPLNDIDIIIAISAEGCTYHENNWIITINVPENCTNLYNLVNDKTHILNSKKVLNLFKTKIWDISQYSKSELKRNEESIVLDLLSYEWKFDIVPAFFTKEDDLWKTYYIIPDWKWNWKKTDPRIDKNRVTEINKKNKSIVLDVIRLVKYWNNRATMPSMPSYLLENMILNYYDYIDLDFVTDFIDIEFINVLSYLSDNIFNDIDDPKWIQWNLNTMEFWDQYKIKNRAIWDIEKAKKAREFEDELKYKESINKWKDIFWPNFPDYE